MSSEEKPKSPVLPVVLTLILCGAIAGAYYYWLEREREASPPPPVETLPPSPVNVEPEIRHPVPTSQPSETAKPLPPLSDSDEPMQDAATTLIDRALLER